MRKSKTIREQNKQRKYEVNKRGKVFLFFAFLVLSSFVFFVIFRMSHQAEKQNVINDEILNLQKEINQLEGENQDLNEVIGYLKTDDFKEKEAKDKLNLIKEGEKMILVKEEGPDDELDLNDSKRKTELVIYRENYYYWWHYFFSIKQDS